MLSSILAAEGGHAVASSPLTAAILLPFFGAIAVALVPRARVELHRALFDPATWNLVSTPHLVFAGRVDGAAVDDAAAGGEGGLSVEMISSAIDLTRTNPAMESDAQQRLRDGDRFRRYGDTAAQIETWWGQSRS